MNGLRSGRGLARRLAAITFVVVLSVVELAHSGGWIGSAAYLGVTVGAGAAAWVAFARRGGRVRMWLALGVAASALADIIFEVHVLVRHVEPQLSVADVPYVLSYVFLIIGVLGALRVGPANPTDVEGVIDMLMIGTVSALVLWEFWLSDSFSDTSAPLMARLVQAAYPMFDVALMAVVVRGVAERRTAAAAGSCIIGGAGLWLVADFWFMVGTPTHLVHDLLDVAWMLGAALLATACWYELPSTRRAHDITAARPVGRGRVVLAVAPFFAAPIIEVITYFQRRDVNPVPMLIATGLFVVLAGARALMLVEVRNRAEAELAGVARRFRAMALNSSDAVLLLDADGIILNEAPNLAAIAGFAGADTRGERALDFAAPDDPTAVRLFHDAIHAPGTVVSGETRVQPAGSGEIWLSLRVVNLLDDPDVQAIVVNLHDITARKHAEDELVHRAFHDSLTGLANRALFRNRVEHALDRRARTGHDPALIYLDLDGFKNVNDSLGHEAGDDLLREVASRLQGIVRTGDTVARLGGDEFGVLLEEPADPLAEAQQVADRALIALGAPIVIGDERLFISASLGIARADELSTATSLLRDADTAMYEAKASGKARWVVYEPMMRAVADERLRLENDLTHALDDNQLSLMFQPVVELASGDVTGFEALVRWNHPDLGTVMPDRFVPIAEENGAILRIGQWVLQEACRAAVEFNRDRAVPLTMAVNVSARQLASPDIVGDVRDALAAAQLDPAILVLEMTETALVKDAAAAAARLRDFRELGVRLAIDDFGTGYSSLTYLRQFPVDILKIDGSFTKTITSRADVPAIVRGLLDLGHTLQLEMVAEGIETGVQLEQLRDQHCQWGQGFYFARPLTGQQVTAMLEASHEFSTHR